MPLAPLHRLLSAQQRCPCWGTEPRSGSPGPVAGWWLCGVTAPMGATAAGSHGWLPTAPHHPPQPTDHPTCKPGPGRILPPPAKRRRADLEHQSLHAADPAGSGGDTRMTLSPHRDTVPGPSQGAWCSRSSSLTPPASAGSRSPPCLPPGTHSLGTPSAHSARGYFGVPGGARGASGPGVRRRSRVGRFHPHLLSMRNSSPPAKQKLHRDNLAGPRHPERQEGAQQKEILDRAI